MILKNKIFIFLFFFNAFIIQNTIQAENFLQLYNRLEKASLNDSNYEFLLQKTLKLATNDHRNKETAQIYEWALCYYTDPETVLKYGSLLEKIGTETQNKEWIIKGIQAKAYAYFLDRNYTESLTYELQALDIIKKLNYPYLYHKSLYGIGTTHLYMAQYQEALAIFKETTTFFKSFKNYDYVFGYFNSKRLEAVCYFYLKNYNQAQSEIQEGLKEMSRLKPEDIAQEKAYFMLTEGMILFKNNQFEKSKTYLTEALPEIIKNDDFANEYLIYLYLGKNDWELNQKEQAFAYFKKIDNLYNSKKYSTLELKKAYDYLILYTKENNDLQNQLYFTNQLLDVTTYLQKKHSYLSQSFIKDSEAQKEKLLKIKSQLTETLNTNKKQNIIFLIISLICVFFLLVLIYKNFKKNKRFKAQYEKLMTAYSLKDLNENYLNSNNISYEMNYINSIKIPLQISNSSHVNSIIEEINLEEHNSEALPEKLVKLFDNKLEQFERNKTFLQKDISLAVLTENWNTNRSYLSKYFNYYKKDSFNSYINNLRVNYAILKLNSDSKYRKYSIDALAIEFGFSKRRHFSDVFIKKTGLTPSYFIQQLKKEKTISQAT